MDNPLELLTAHRSIRRFTDEELPEESVRAAVEAGQRASTSSLMQAYCLLRVRDAAARAALVELTGGQPMVAAAAAFFVVCGDTRRHRLACAQEGRPYDARLEAFLVAVVDASLFAQNVALAFEAQGFGVCYVGGLRNRLPEVDRLLDLPEGVYPLYGLCVGRPAEDPLPKPRLPLDAVLLDGRYPDDDTLRAHLAEHEERLRAYREQRGAAPQPWTATVAERLSVPRRTDLAAYYASKGARLD